MPLSRFMAAIGKPKAFVPIIEVTDECQALTQVEAAMLAGVDGVFLLGRTISDASLNSTYRKARNEHPDLFIGVNYSESLPAQSFRTLDPSVQALWSTTNFVCDGHTQQKEAQEIYDARHVYRCRALFFGSVEPCPQVRSLEAGRALALSFLDVLTLAGHEDDSDPSMLSEVRQSLGHTAVLAVTTRVPPERVGACLPHVDCFMNGSQVGNSNLDPDYLADLADAVHSRAFIRAVD